MKMEWRWLSAGVFLMLSLGLARADMDFILRPLLAS